MVYYNKFGQQSNERTPENQLTTLRRNSAEQDDRFQVVSIIKLENSVSGSKRKTRIPFRGRTHQQSANEELTTMKEIKIRDSHRSLQKEVHNELEIDESRGKQMMQSMGTTSKDQKTGTDNEAYQVVMNELKNFQSFARDNNTFSHSNLDRENGYRRASCGTDLDSVKTVAEKGATLENQAQLSYSYFRPLVKIEQGSQENIMQDNKPLQMKENKKIKIQSRSGKTVQAYARITHTMDGKFQIRLLNRTSLARLHVLLCTYLNGRSQSIRHARMTSVSQPKTRSEFIRTPLMPRPVSYMEKQIGQHNADLKMYKSILLDFYLRLPYLGNSAVKKPTVTDQSNNLYTFRFKQFLVNPAPAAESAMQLLRLADLEVNLSRIVPEQNLNIIKENLTVQEKINFLNHEEEGIITEAEESERIQRLVSRNPSKKEVLLLDNQPYQSVGEMSDEHSPMRSMSVKNSFVDLNLGKKNEKTKEPRMITVEYPERSTEVAPDLLVIEDNKPVPIRTQSIQVTHRNKDFNNQGNSTSPKQSRIGGSMSSLDGKIQSVGNSTLTIKSNQGERKVYPTKAMKIVLKEKLHPRSHANSSYIEKKQIQEQSISIKPMNNDLKCGSQNNYSSKQRPPITNATYQERIQFQSAHVSTNNFLLDQSPNQAMVPMDMHSQEMQQSIEDAYEQSLVQRVVQSKQQVFQKPMWLVSTAKKGVDKQSKYKMQNQKGGQFMRPSMRNKNNKNSKNLARWFSHNLVDIATSNDPLSTKRPESRTNKSKNLLSFTNSQCVPMRQYDLSSSLSGGQKVYLKQAIKGKKIEVYRSMEPRSAFGSAVIQSIHISNNIEEKNSCQSIMQTEFENQLLKQDVADVLSKSSASNPIEKIHEQLPDGKHVFRIQRRDLEFPHEPTELTVNKINMSYRSQCSSQKRQLTSTTSSQRPKTSTLKPIQNMDLPAPIFYQQNPSTAKGSASIKMIGSPVIMTEKTSEKNIPKEIFFAESNSQINAIQQGLDQRNCRNLAFSYSPHEKQNDSIEGHLVELLTKNDNSKESQSQEKTRVFRRVASSVSQLKEQSDISTHRVAQISSVEDIAKNETTIEEGNTQTRYEYSFPHGEKPDNQAVFHNKEIFRGYSAKQYTNRQPFDTKVITLLQFKKPVTNDVKRGKFMSSKNPRAKSNHMHEPNLHSEFPEVKQSMYERNKKSRVNTQVIAQRISVAGLKNSNESELNIQSPNNQTAYMDSSMLKEQISANPGYTEKSIHSSHLKPSSAHPEDRQDSPANEKQSMGQIDDGFVGQPIYETQEGILTQSQLKQFYNQSENTSSQKKQEKKKRAFTPSAQQMPNFYHKTNTVNNQKQSSASKNLGLQKQNTTPMLSKQSPELSANSKTEPLLISQEKQGANRKFIKNRSRQSFEVTPIPDQISAKPSHFSPFIPSGSFKRGSSKANFVQVVNQVVEDTTQPIEVKQKTSLGASSEKGNQSFNERGDYSDVGLKGTLSLRSQRKSSIQTKVISVSTEHDKKSSMRSNAAMEKKSSRSSFTNKPQIEVVHRNLSPDKNAIETLVVDTESDEVKKATNLLTQDNVTVEEYVTKLSFDQKSDSADANEMATQTRRPNTSHGHHATGNEMLSESTSQHTGITRLQQKMVARVAPPMIIQSIHSQAQETDHRSLNRPRMALINKKLCRSRIASSIDSNRQTRQNQLLRRNMSVHRRQVTLMAQHYANVPMHETLISRESFGISTHGSTIKEQTQPSHTSVPQKLRRKQTVVLIPGV